jgi:hyperosmotically inducible protein
MGLGDWLITYRVKSVLSDDPDIPARDINVNTSNGVVTLLGNVPWDGMREKVEEKVRHIEGVRSVNNQLREIWT